jgi:hypothetical protein
LPERFEYASTCPAAGPNTACTPPRACSALEAALTLSTPNFTNAAPAARPAAFTIVPNLLAF